MTEHWLAQIDVWKDWLWTGAGFVVGAVAGLIAWRLAVWVFARFTRSTDTATDDALLEALRGPAALILPAYGAQLGLGAVPVPALLASFLPHALSLVMIAGVR